MLHFIFHAARNAIAAAAESTRANDRKPDRTVTPCFG